MKEVKYIKLKIFLFACSLFHDICLELGPSYNATICIRILTQFLVEEEHINKITVQILLLMKRNNMLVQEILYGTLIHLLSLGGVDRIYEKIVISVKRCLKKILGKNTVTYEELQTILYETEIIFNKRPLTLLMKIQMILDLHLITCYLADA